jgi:hypothetical protein
MRRRCEERPEEDGSEQLETRTQERKKWKEIIEQVKTHKEL